MAGSRTAAFASDTTNTNLSTSNATMTLNGTDEAGAIDFPRECVLGLATVVLDSIVTAASITWYISEDADGDRPITASVTSTIAGQTAGSGGIAASINVPFVITVTTGTLYLQMVTDAGTARATRGAIYFSTPKSR